MQLRDTKGKFRSKKVIIAYIWVIVFIVMGVNYVLEKYIDWRNQYDLVYRFPINFTFNRIISVVKRPESVIISPIVVSIEKETEFNPIEQKIIDRFGYKAGIVALAIFDCGESGLDQYAVSRTGDLGIAQINWPTWKGKVKDKFGYTAMDMFSEDKNIEVAEWIYNRDGVKESGDESWNPWVGYTSGAYTRCFK